MYDVGLAIGMILILGIYVCYKAYLITDIKPMVIEEHVFDQQIEDTTAKNIEIALEALRCVYLYSVWCIGSDVSVTVNECLWCKYIGKRRGNLLLELAKRRKKERKS